MRELSIALFCTKLGQLDFSLFKAVIASSIPDQTSRIPPPGLSMPTSSSRQTLGNSAHMGTGHLGPSFQPNAEHIGGSHSLESSHDPSSR